MSQIYLLVLSQDHERIVCCIEAEQKADALAIATNHPDYCRLPWVHAMSPYLYTQEKIRPDQDPTTAPAIYKKVPEITITVKHNPDHEPREM